MFRTDLLSQPEPSRELDLPEGGIAVIEDSVLEKGPPSQNADMIAFAAEKYDLQRTHAFTMSRSVLIDDLSAHLSSAQFVHFFKPASDGTTIRGNTLVGPGKDAAALAAENSVQADRAAAGFPEYPWLPYI